MIMNKNRFSHHFGPFVTNNQQQLFYALHKCLCVIKQHKNLVDSRLLFRKDDMLLAGVPEDNFSSCIIF